MPTTNKTLQLKRQDSFASSVSAKQAIESAFASGKFAIGEPVIAIMNDGSVILGIQGDATRGSVFYNATTVDAAIQSAKLSIIGDATHYLTLGALEDAVDEISGTTSGYEITEVSTSVPQDVKKRYQLSKVVGSTKTKQGEYIDIPKDSHIVSITYINDPEDEHYQNIEYVYIDVSGTTQTSYVDLSGLVLEASFASGVTSTNNVVHGVVDPTSENFLTVGAGGFKLSGVTAAITEAIQDLDTADSPVTDKFVTAVVQQDGTLTISREQASASGTTATPIASGATTVAVTGTTVQEQISSLGKTAKTLQDESYSGLTAGNGIEVTPQTHGDSVALKLTTSGATADLLSFNATTKALEISDTYDCGTWS